MKGDALIYTLKPGIKLSDAGNKAQSLNFLKKHNFRIPTTYLLPSHHYEDFKRNRDLFLTRLKTDFESLPDKSYAVRSSASSEDGEECTNAGQLRTVTNVKGIEGLIIAVAEVWDSAFYEKETSYNKKKGCDNIECAVIIQEMISSCLAGVSFSKNPVTNIPEVIIEAVEGPGEDLVQKGITPLRWRFRKKRLIEGDQEYRLLKVIKQISKDTLKLKRLYDNDVDIEWVYNGKKLYYLQLRPVTAQREMKIYSNRMAKEMLPGQIKPLVWSVNIPLVNGTWIKILSEITGRLNVEPGDLARPFYYRTYFNIAALSKIFREFGLSSDALENLLMSNNGTKPSFRPGVKSLRHFFRIIRFIHHKLTFEKIFPAEYENLKKTYDELRNSVGNDFTSDRYFSMYNRLFEEGQKLAYLNIIVPIMMQIYNKRLKGKLRKHGLDYDQLDFNSDFPELTTFSPLPVFERIKSMINALPEPVRSEFNSYEKAGVLQGTAHIKKEFENLLLEFGHLSESGNDFSMPKWNENPGILFDLIKSTEPVGKNKVLLTFSQLNENSGKKISGLKSLYIKAGKFKVNREKISSLFIYGHGLFRLLYINVGRLFAEKGIIEFPEDIFYLYKSEIDAIMEEFPDGQINSYEALITSRKNEMESTSNYILPSVIYGDQPPVVETGKVKNHSGVGTSPGIFTGKTRVVRESDGYKSVVRGDVLIIPFSDVSWTPILSMAGAIVSETGGLLSHSSIIAREMGIPALASVENACSIGSGINVTVDGSNGILSILDNE